MDTEIIFTLALMVTRLYSDFITGWRLNPQPEAVAQ